MRLSTNESDNLKITPSKRRRQPTESRDASSTRTPTRTRMDSWRGSLRAPSQRASLSPAKATPTTAASAVTASATTSALEKGALSCVAEIGMPAMPAAPAAPPAMSISIPDTPRPIAIPTNTHTRARRRRRSSISRFSSCSCSPPSSPPTYSASLPDPLDFMTMQDLEIMEGQSHLDSELPEPTPPLMVANRLSDEPLASPPPFLSTSFPPPDRDGAPTNDAVRPIEGRQELTTWWNYRSWTSATIKADSESNVDPGALDEPGVGAPSNNPLPSPLPPIVSFPLTDPQTTMATAVVGLSLLNNIHATSEPESSKPDGNAAHTPESTDKQSEGAWYAYVPVPWSWGSAGPGTTAADPSVSGPSENVAGALSDSAAVQKQGANDDPVSDSHPQPQEEEAPVNAVDPQPPSSSEEPNPLTTSFQKDTLTWASFLRTSRRLLSVKRVTDGAPSDNGVKTDENGVEVMDVDFEEEAGDDAKPEAKEVVGLPLLFVSDGDGSNANTKHGGPSIASGSPSVAAGLASRIWTSTTTSSTTTTTTTNQLSRSPTPSRPASRTALDSQQTPPSRAPTPSQRHASPAPSKRSISSKPKPPNVVLPKWEETFLSAPRSVVSAGYRARVRARMGMGMGVCDGERMMLGRGIGGEEGIGGKILGRTVKFVSGLLGSGPAGVKDGERGGVQGEEDMTSEVEKRLGEFGQELPKAWKVLDSVSGGNGLEADVLRGCKKVVVIGVHGWFPGTIVRTVLGEPTGTSTKFASMMGSALEEFEKEYGVAFEKVTLVPLEGEGTIEKRVDKLYANLLSNPEWTNDLHECDVLFFAAHSQGCVVSTHLLDRLLVDGHVVTHTQNSHGYTPSGRKHQRVCILALCGIHLGPLRYLSSSTLVGPYLQYFESIAARELFAFQNTDSEVSKNYVRALGNVLDHGTKVVYIASLNDQVVPMYSGLFTAASHPLILRALYIDGDAYSSSDFLSNLLTLLIRILNSGLSDSGLLAHLSEATAGSLNGVGHSTVYEEMGNYTLAVKYLFLANEGGGTDAGGGAKLRVEPFDALLEQNDYEIPWSLRDLIANPLTSFLFASEIDALREGFKAWHPKTTILRELRKKVAPLGRVSDVGGGSGRSGGGSMPGVVSKL